MLRAARQDFDEAENLVGSPEFRNSNEKFSKTQNIEKNSRLDENSEKTEKSADRPETQDIGGKLRIELKRLLSSENFKKIKDVDEMTDILMQKLAEIAD